MASHEPLTAWAVIKNASYLGAFLIGLSQESYTILVAFMILDTILGVCRVYVVHGGHAIKSYRLVSGLMAKLTMLMVPLLIAYLGKGVGMELTVLAVWSLNLLIFSHFYSILGNIHSIYLRRDTYEFDAISYVLTKIQLVFERFLKAGAPTKESEAPPTNRDMPK